jgi:hypothetical protein
MRDPKMAATWRDGSQQPHPDVSDAENGWCTIAVRCPDIESGRQLLQFGDHTEVLTSTQHSYVSVSPPRSWPNDTQPQPHDYQLDRPSLTAKHNRKLLLHNAYRRLPDEIDIIGNECRYRLAHFVVKRAMVTINGRTPATTQIRFGRRHGDLREFQSVGVGHERYVRGVRIVPFIQLNGRCSLLS